MLGLTITYQLCQEAGYSVSLSGGHESQHPPRTVETEVQQCRM